MNTFRPIQSIHKAPTMQMGHITIRQAFPLQGIEQVNPFILLHHFDFEMEAGINIFDVPPHPHRGFCPITFMFEGQVEHRDSLGNHKVIGSNEVQWINAGRGIIHSETAPKAFVETGGRLQGIQLWINLPSTEKMKAPSYQPLTKDEIVLIEKEGVEFRLVSGTFDGKKGPAFSEALTAMLRMEIGTKWEFNFAAKENVAIYILEGKIAINGKVTEDKFGLIHFKNEEGKIEISALEASKLLIMAGEAIEEPMVSHGPFVMNTQTEIMEAMRDYRQGKMGFLPA